MKGLYYRTLKLRVLNIFMRKKNIQ